MSHFAVLVIGNNIEAQLAPYQENNMDDCPREYMEFCDEEDNLRQEYQKDTIDQVVLSNGELVFTFDEKFRVPGTFGTGTDTHKIPSNLEVRKVPFTEKYNTFEEFLIEWHGCNEKDDITGKYGYWKNPNAKWDWYLVGGRWTGFFKLKSGRSGNLGIPGIFTSKPELGYADCAVKRDIDFDRMFAVAEQDGSKRYDGVIKILGKNIKLQYYWEQILMDAYDEVIGLNQREKGKFFWNQPDAKIWKANKKELENKFGILVDIERFTVSKQEYVKCFCERSISTHAVIQNGQWHESGEMGSFCMVKNGKSHNTWHKTFVDIITNTPEDEVLTLVDCHI